MSVPQTCCEAELRNSGKAFSGHNQNGDRWTCPACRTEYVYSDDEAKGGEWKPIRPGPIFAAGQRLWFVPRAQKRTGEPADGYSVTIAKVGRKWLTLDCDVRVDKTDLCADGGNYVSPGRCYLSREAYVYAKELRDAWRAFRDRVADSYSPPPGATQENIDAARRAFGV